MIMVYLMQLVEGLTTTNLIYTNTDSMKIKIDELKNYYDSYDILYMNGDNNIIKGMVFYKSGLDNLSVFINQCNYKRLYGSTWDAVL